MFDRSYQQLLDFQITHFLYNILLFYFWHPQQESNLQLALRRGLLYPFNYESKCVSSYLYIVETLFYYLISVFPPMYGLNASGIRMLPSACILFSKNAINILGGATTVLFNVCAKYFLPSAPFTRIPSLLA